MQPPGGESITVPNVDWSTAHQMHFYALLILLFWNCVLKLNFWPFKVLACCCKLLLWKGLLFAIMENVKVTSFHNDLTMFFYVGANNLVFKSFYWLHILVHLHSKTDPESNTCRQTKTPVSGVDITGTPEEISATRQPGSFFKWAIEDKAAVLTPNLAVE